MGGMSRSTSTTPFVVCAFALATLAVSLGAGAKISARTLVFTYRAVVDAVPKNAGPIDIFVPIAQSSAWQEVLSHEVRASVAGQERTEAVYGNRFWHGHFDRSNGQPIEVVVTTRLRRRSVTTPADRLTGSTSTELSEGERLQHARFLRANRRVPIDSKQVRELVGSIAPGERSLVRIARATYEYVVDHMEYKKVGRGWGNGDTHWACSQKYGNCTDFHALFTSLARARGIPARFEIGVPLPLEKPRGKVAGYHCWVRFFVPDVGWIPIDASEAKKHPEQRNAFFGAQAADRIRLSVGRDLELGEGHTCGALNYFLYPHVEVGGKRYHAVKTEFSFEDAPPSSKR